MGSEMMKRLELYLGIIEWSGHDVVVGVTLVSCEMGGG